MDVLQLDPANATHIKQFSEIRLRALHTDPAVFDSTYERELTFSDAPSGEDVLRALPGILALFSPPSLSLPQRFVPRLPQQRGSGRTKRLLHPLASSALVYPSQRTQRSGACGWRPSVGCEASQQNSSTALRRGQSNPVRIPRPCGCTTRTMELRLSIEAEATNSLNRTTSRPPSPMPVAEKSACGHVSQLPELLYADVL